MATPGLKDEARLTPEERQERVCLDFFLAELGRLRDRGFLAPVAFETLEAETQTRRGLIERHAVFRSEIEAARRLAEKFPREALEHAEKARLANPTAREPWILTIKLQSRLGDDAAALAACEEANTQVPGFGWSVEQLRAEIDARTSGPEAFPVDEARAALQRGDLVKVVELCRTRLATQPDHYDATVLLAFTRQRQGRFVEALDLYRKLQKFEPGNPTWSQWIDTIEMQMAARPSVVLERSATFEPAVTLSRVEPEKTPRLSWSSVAGEFLQDHWQKLILCLAVLLIVVSSNVAASQLLGPKLWSPVGKCLLALVYTVMFAGLGSILVRWGAERAGRIMLMTTLIVVPADFMLAGQMKLLTAPTAFGFAVLGIDAAALFVVIWLSGPKRLRLGSADRIPFGGPVCVERVQCGVAAGRELARGLEVCAVSVAGRRVSGVGRLAVNSTPGGAVGRSAGGDVLRARPAGVHVRQRDDSQRGLWTGPLADALCVISDGLFAGLCVHVGETGNV